MPPTAGFVSEWFVFQTVFQGFHLPYLAGRLTLALTGAGLALTAAVAFATFAKVVGLGVLSRTRARAAPIGRPYVGSVGLLGLLVLALAAGMPLWLRELDGATMGLFGMQIASGARRSVACAADRQIRVYFAEPSGDRDAAPLAHSHRLGGRDLSQTGSANAGLVRRPLSGPDAGFDDGVDLLQRDADLLQLHLPAHGRHRARRGCRRLFRDQAEFRARRGSDFRTSAVFSPPSSSCSGWQ